MTAKNQQDRDSSKRIQLDGPAGNLLRRCVRLTYRRISRPPHTAKGGGGLSRSHWANIYYGSSLLSLSVSPKCA